jgi:hypothetical protein
MTSNPDIYKDIPTKNITMQILRSRRRWFFITQGGEKDYIPLALTIEDIKILSKVLFIHIHLTI